MNHDSADIILWVCGNYGGIACSNVHLDQAAGVDLARILYVEKLTIEGERKGSAGKHVVSIPGEQRFPIGLFVCSH